MPILNTTNIPQSDYVNINTVLLQNNLIAQRDFITRVFTQNPLLPPNSYQEFLSAFQVGLFFGTASTEYAIASFYFGLNLLPKSITTKPQKICFARYSPTAVPPQIFGAKVTLPVSSLQPIDDGAFILTIGAVAHNITGIDFSGDTNFIDMAATIQAAINSFTADPQFATATVTWDSTRLSFDFAGGVAEKTTISVGVSVSGTNILPYIGWTTLATYGNGSDGDSITDTLQESASASNNFASFMFYPALDNDGTVEAATWLAGYIPNYSFYYLISATPANAPILQPLLLGIDAAMMITLNSEPGEFKELIPGIVQAATNYSASGIESANFLQTPNLTPDVTTQADKLNYDSLYINYVGRTQEYGVPYIFYQKSVLLPSLNISPSALIFTNEQWLKTELNRACQALINSKTIPQSSEGVALITSVLTPVILRANTNGVITKGQSLTDDNKSEITTATGDANAWQIVETNGSYLKVEIQNAVGTFLLIYTAAGEIYQIVGTDYLVAPNQ